MRKRKWGLAAAGAALAIAIGAGMVMAQSDEDGAGVTFLDRLAEKLGIDRQTLDTAIEDARLEEIDEAVANGDLTQEQADRLKRRLDNLPPDAPFFGPGFGHKRPGGEFRFGYGEGEFGFAFKFAFGRHGIGFDNEAMAEFLGIDQATLSEELRADGATLASVAGAHGKSRDELIAFIVGGLQEKLDAAVAAGDVTQEQADEMLANATERVGEMVDQEFGGRPFAGRFKDGFGFAVPFGPGIPFVLEDLAGFLGIDQPQLFEELRADGATLATVAEAHGKTRDELKAFLSRGIQEKLDAMVEEGMITQDRAGEILSNFNERIDALIDEAFPFGGPWGGRFRHGPFPFGGDMFEEEMEILPESPDGELTPASRS